MADLKEQPFALIGVNSWPHEPGELKAIMQAEQLPWRSFDDQGVVDPRWNPLVTPTFYVIDAAGVIRRRWVGKAPERALDAALASLIAEAEAAASGR